MSAHSTPSWRMSAFLQGQTGGTVVEIQEGLQEISHQRVYKLMIQHKTIKMTPASQPSADTAEGKPSTPAPIIAVTL